MAFLRHLECIGQMGPRSAPIQDHLVNNLAAPEFPRDRWSMTGTNDPTGVDIAVADGSDGGPPCALNAAADAARASRRTGGTSN
jgi:hypothetical protein